MAKNFGARKDSKYKVVSSSPSVNKTPRGPAIVDVPYDVQQNLSKSDVVSPNVYFNAKPVYVKTSHSTKVTGDKQGSHGGVKSGTVEGQSDPIQASPSVFVNGKAVVRVGDVQHMQNKNTVGKVTSSESGSAAHITDDGKIAAAAAPEPIPTPYAKNKPTNHKGSGSLGSRTGSPVLLKSGKLFYSVNDTDLIAPVPFSLRRFYLSDESSGIFGKGWQCAYENKLVRSDPQTLSLIFTDDQIFRFTYSDKGFIDEDDLGAKLTLVSSQTFLLEYFADAHTELYVNGHLNHIQDRNGNTLNIVRESNGRLIRITSSLAALSFSYNKEGFVSRVVSHVGSAWNYTYDEEHRLTEVHDPLGGITRYGYGKPFLEQIIDPSGVVILNVTYDSNGRVESYREEGVRYTYAYSPNRVIKTETSGDKTFYGIDNFGAIRAITYPDATTTREEYHDDTSIIIDEGGNTHIRVFDKRHRIIREVHPDKNVILYSYKGNNPYPSIINHEDKITAHVYDERYNLLSTTYSDGTTESYSYDDRGNQITFIDRSSVSTSYGYNDLGLRIRYSDALGGITQNVYDELGNCITIIDPEERITQFEYDTLSRLISITDNAQKTIFFHYDKAGRKSALVDPLGNTTRYIYDENGFLRTEIAPDARQKHYAYDRGLLTSITHEEKVNGEARETTLGCGAKYSFSYDKKRHCLSKSIGDKTTHYTYDTLGNILTIDDGVNTVEYVYDINANVLLERLGNESVSYAYNPDGTKRFIGYADAHYRLVRDESGNLVEIRKGLESYALKYDPLGNQTSLTYPNRLSQKSQFDPLGRIAKRSWGENEPLAYTYDKSSRIVMKNTTPYRYDEAGRIASTGDEDYDYDEAGNLLRGESTIDSVSGRLMRQGEVEFSYDPLGRLIVKRSPITQSIYSYDAEGYLVRYVKTPVRPEEIKNIVELGFTYDPLGRRLTKHFKSFVVSLSNHETINEYHHRYLYAGDNIVAIYDNDTDELIATLLHDEGLDTPLSISLYDKETLSTDELDSMSEEERYLYTQSLIQTYYYHRDHQNSIIALTNKEGQIVESYSYDPYGTIIHSTKTVETYNPYGYTGREIDTDDLCYYRARYYDPTIGRFITPDPIGFMGGDTNFYRYVGNDPVNFNDPSGLLGNGTPQTSSQNSLSSAFESFNNSIRSIFSPNPSNPCATMNQGDGCKVAGTASRDCTITNAYFAEQAEREVLADSGTYKFFSNITQTATAQQKTKIAKIILKNIKDKNPHGEKYPTEASIKEALTKESYNKGDTITFKRFKKEKYSKRINEASIGQKVTLVATLSGCPAGQNVTFKIYEKSPMLMTAGKELIMLKAGAQVTEVTVTSQGTFAVVEVELRPKKDKKSSVTDTSPSLELWQEKFKHAPNTAEKFDHLWLKVSSPSAKNTPQEYLKGEELKLRGEDCTSKFHKVSKIVLRHEGGYVNDPNDSGGATNKGIAWKTWTAYAKSDLNVEPTLENLKLISDADAEIIYRKRYWEPKGFCKIKNDRIGLMVYDWSITSGRAIKKVQQLLKDEFQQNISTTGSMDEGTISSLNNIVDQDKLLDRISEIRKDYYTALAYEADGTTPSKNHKFLNGWINRVNDCMGVQI